MAGLWFARPAMTEPGIQQRKDASDRPLSTVELYRDGKKVAAFYRSGDFSFSQDALDGICDDLFALWDRLRRIREALS